jgi:predicted NBD/HSP70 family sugar kinase
MADPRLFLGLDAHCGSLRAVALDACGEWVLRARFPLPQPDDVDLDFGPASPIAACLEALVRAHAARVEICTHDRPAVLPALARRLGEDARILSALAVARTALDDPAADLLVDEFASALRLALLGALAASWSDRP